MTVNYSRETCQGIEFRGISSCYEARSGEKSGPYALIHIKSTSTNLQYPTKPQHRQNAQPSRFVIKIR